MTLFLMILGGVAALALGFWLGFGQYNQSQSELERRLGEKGQRRKAKRHYMWVSYLLPGAKESERKKRGRSGRFHTVAPERRSEEENRPDS